MFKALLFTLSYFVRKDAALKPVETGHRKFCALKIAGGKKKISKRAGRIGLQIPVQRRASKGSSFLIMGCVSTTKALPRSPGFPASLWMPRRRRSKVGITSPMSLCKDVMIFDVSRFAGVHICLGFFQ